MLFVYFFVRLNVACTNAANMNVCASTSTSSSDVFVVCKRPEFNNVFVLKTAPQFHWACVCVCVIRRILVNARNVIERTPT